VNWLRKGFWSHLNASKDSSGKLIEVDDRILEHKVRYLKTQFVRENSDEESDEGLILTAEP
jgi:hypothetical protein